jgi:hypothetical protein
MACEVSSLDDSRSQDVGLVKVWVEWVWVWDAATNQPLRSL